MILDPPDRVPPHKLLWREFATDPRLVFVGAAARGLYATILAACDAEGIVRHEGSQRADAILAHSLGETVDDVRGWLGRLVAEGLVREELFGVALPSEAFLRRQPQLRPASRDAERDPSTPLFAPPTMPSWSDPRPTPAARRSASIRVANADAPDAPAPRMRVVRVRTPSGSAMSPTERSDRYRYARAIGRFRRRPAQMPFEQWLVTTSEGRSLLATRRERAPGYALACTPEVVATGSAGAETGNATGKVPLRSVTTVAAPSPPHTPPLLPENEGLEGIPSNPSSDCNEEGGGVRETATQPATAGDDPEVALRRPGAVADLDTRREGTIIAARAARAFLDAVNVREVIDGLQHGREVVMEFGQGVKVEHTIALGRALLDAGVTPGSELLASLVKVLRDRETFRRIYARRKCVTLGKITTSELVYGDAFALKQALAEVIGPSAAPATTTPQKWAAQSVPRDPSWTGKGPIRATLIDVKKMMAERAAAKATASG